MRQRSSLARIMIYNFLFMIITGIMKNEIMFYISFGNVSLACLLIAFLKDMKKEG